MYLWWTKKYICTQISKCDMGKYNTRWAFERTHYSLHMCCIFQCCLKMNKICIFSLSQVTQGITGIRFSSNYNKREIWTDTDIRLIVKTTAYSVIWADTDIRLLVKTIAQNVIYADILRADCQRRTLVPRFNSGANAAPISVHSMSVQC